MSNKWTNQFLDSMREMTDPLADEVVTTVVQSGGLEAFNQMMKQLVNNHDEIPTSLPPVVHEFFEQTKALPDWADQEKIVRGEQVFDLYGPEMVTMLFFVALPTAYAAKRGSHVLRITSELTKHVHRRIFRTAQFILDVMQAGGLGPNGRGIQSAQKLRLLHASIRYYIANKPEWKSKWDPAWGLPINQEDLAGTMMDFSVGVLRGLQRGRIRLSPEETEAYIHCWKVIGHILGICPDLMPENVEDAFDLADTIIPRQLGESDSGKLLMKDLIRFLQRFLPRPFYGFPATATRYLVGDKIADMIEVSPFDWTLALIKLQFLLFDIAERLKQRFPGLQTYIRFVTWNLFDRVVIFEEGNQGTSLQIPDYLRKHWRLSRS